MEYYGTNITNVEHNHESEAKSWILNDNQNARRNDNIEINNWSN